MLVQELIHVQITQVTTSINRTASRCRLRVEGRLLAWRLRRSRGRPYALRRRHPCLARLIDHLVEELFTLPPCDITRYDEFFRVQISWYVIYVYTITGAGLPLYKAALCRVTVNIAAATVASIA